MAEDLKSGRPRMNPGCGQSAGTRTRDRWIASATGWPLGHTAHDAPVVQKMDSAVHRRNHRLVEKY